MDTTTAPATPATSSVVPVPSATTAHAGNRALMAIALFKLVKAAMVFAAAFGLFRMVNKDTAVEVRKIIHVFRIQDDSKIAKAILLKANVIDNPKKRIYGGLLVFYGLLFSVEGIGLLARKRWAEYFTIVLTATGIPIELYEIFHRTKHATHGVAGQLVPEAQMHLFVFDRWFIFKVLALVLNVAILWFLIAYVRRNDPHRLKEAAPANPA